MHENRIIYGFLLWQAFISLAAADAEVLVRFETYNNPSGKIRSGRCCDLSIVRCSYGCDYYFKVCMDDPTGPENTKSCNYGRFKTDVAFENKRDVVFGDTIGGYDNPFLFKIPGTINRMVTLKVDVKDEDQYTRNDYVDYVRSDIWLYKGIFDEIQMPIDLISRTRLETIVTIRCAPNYYGEDCGIYCEPPSAYDHYTCSRQTGTKICDYGWSGNYCDQPDYLLQLHKKNPEE